MFGFIVQLSCRFVFQALLGLRGYSPGTVIVLVLGTSVLAQDIGEDELQARIMNEVHGDLLREMVRRQDDTSALEIFIGWPAHLERVAKDDPEEALRQRMPMAACRASVLAPKCNELITLFAPEPNGLIPSAHGEFIRGFNLRRVLPDCAEN